MSICLLLSLPIIIAYMQALRWHHLSHCMEDGVNHLLGGLKLGDGLDSTRVSH